MALAACGDGSGPAHSGEGQATKTTNSSGPAEPLARLRLSAPNATLAFSAPFSLIGSGGPLAKVADKVERESWTTPDMLRSQLVDGGADVTAVPTNVAANLYNKGVGIRMAAMLVWGLLYVVGPEGNTGGWKSLRGQTVMVPFQNDMPDLVFRYLAKANGLEPGKDFTIEYYAQPPEIVARLVSGMGKWAVLPEHLATLTLDKTNEAGRGLGRVLDLQVEWGRQTGSDRIPLAGVVVSPAIAARPDVLEALLEELRDKVALMNALDPTTMESLSATFKLPVATLSAIIPRLRLDVVSGADARKELERFYTELAELNADLIGGKLPDHRFYLSVP